ncbi:MAG: repair protein RecO [Candidatus Saccharibacteria bacterium]|nr:repair protein RecO [Candidatus Saccharibacteria bacterium]
MKQLTTKAIILSRTDYGEADRIVTLLTPEAGKLRLIARGVRKSKSKLAGGIELFSVSDITYMHGKGDLGTLISARLDKHYGKIIQDITRVQLGYDLIKLLNKITEDNPDSEYFHLLDQSFSALNDAALPVDLVRLWFEAQLIKFGGHEPDLFSDTTGQKLEQGKIYTFSFEDMAFAVHPTGSFGADQIKFLRLVFQGHQPNALMQVQGAAEFAGQVKPLLESLRRIQLQH